MAYADYCLCLRCGEKAFYDANLNWGNWGPVQYNREGRPIPDDAGDYAGLCTECAKTHRLVIEELPARVAQVEEECATPKPPRAAP